MSMNLEDLVPSLKRAAATPGQFATLFPEADDNDLAALLADAIAEAQLDGLLTEVDLDPTALTADALSVPQQALVVIYAAARMLSAQLANLKNRARYKAGSVESETETTSTILVELLKQAAARKQQIRDDVKYGVAGTDFGMVDLYLARSIDDRWGYQSQGWNY